MGPVVSCSANTRGHYYTICDGWFLLAVENLRVFLSYMFHIYFACIKQLGLKKPECQTKSKTFGKCLTNPWRLRKKIRVVNNNL